jgi:hypothetical protein
MAINSFKVKRSLNIDPSTDAGTQAGDLRVDSSDSNKVKYYNGTTEDQVITAEQLADLEYDNATSGLTATNPKDAIDEVAGSLSGIQSDIDDHIADTADAHDASAISVTPTGNLAADDVQEALVELQTDVDTRITASSADVLANKSIDADSNTITNIDNADIKAGAAIARTKLASGSNDHVIINDDSGVLSSEAQLAISRGGTGQSTAQAAIDALLPTQTGNSGEFLSTNGTNAAWAPVTVTPIAPRSVTTTDTATNADDVLLLSGASFTQTLYTAAGNSGRRITLIHAGTSLSQVYTLATASGQTIGGIASGSYALYTNGEVLKLVSDGTNWLIEDHKTTTAWTTYSLPVTGTSGNPTLGTGGATLAQWRRVGDSMDIIYSHYQTGAGAAGTNTLYLFGLPTSATANTSKTIIPGILPTHNSVGFGGTMLGSGTASITSLGNTNGFNCTDNPFLYNSTNICLIGAAGAAFQGYPVGSSNATNFGASNVFITFRANVVISGWQP